MSQKVKNLTRQSETTEPNKAVSQKQDTVLFLFSPLLLGLRVEVNNIGDILRMRTGASGASHHT